MRHVLHGAAAQRLDAPAAAETIARHGHFAEALHTRMSEAVREAPAKDAAFAMAAVVAAELVGLHKTVSDLQARLIALEAKQ